MAFVGNNILETCAAPSNTTTINLAGVVSGYSTFRSQNSNGSAVGYVIRNSTEWEVGTGTLTHGTPDTLSRDAVLSNHLGTTNRVAFTGSAFVYNTIPAERAVYKTASEGITITGTLNAGVVVGASGSFSGAVSITGTATVGAIVSGPVNVTGTVAASGVITAANGTATTQVVNFSQFNPTVSGGTVNTLMPGGVRWQAKSESVTTDGSGNATITFPSAFSTSAPTVIVCNGNAATSASDVYVVGTTASAVLVYCPGRLSASFRVNWIAIGAA